MIILFHTNFVLFFLNIITLSTKRQVNEMYKVKISKKDLYSFNYTKQEVIEKTEDTFKSDLSDEELLVVVELLDKLLSIKNSSENACNEAS